MIVAAVVAVALVVTLAVTLPGGGAESSRPASALGWGVTHTQYSAEDGDPSAVRAAREALSAQSVPQNQHIMGWGADNPEPSPGHYDFETLDERIDLIRETHGTPVITLCCAPDWMKGGTPGRTDWSRQSLETAPSPDHYDDFADLAATIAARYPDVRHFIVWNEFKGFFDDTGKRWDYEGYTAFYNQVYRALKKVNKENLVGGPYLNMDSFGPGHTRYASALKGPWGSVDRRVLEAFDYWNRHKAGADFVVVDGASYTRDGQALPDEFRATEKFTAIGRWIARRTPLPLWWAEYYIDPSDDHGSGARRHDARRFAVQVTAMTAIAEGGATTAFYWNPQRPGERCADCLWHSTDVTGGAPDGALPMMDLIRRFDTEFPPGTTFRPVAVTGDDAGSVRVLADDQAVLVVNTLDRPVQVRIDGWPVGLDAYQVRWLSGR
ncbi:GH39 family glycosyl hydrolase [Streptomyces sp. NPDC054829]